MRPAKRIREYGQILVGAVLWNIKERLRVDDWGLDDHDEILEYDYDPWVYRRAGMEVDNE